MTLSSDQIAYIKESFSQMRSKQDLLDLLNFAKKNVYGEPAIPFELKHLNYHATPQANKKRYNSFSVKKKSGEDRIIYAPNKGLKSIQKCLNLILQAIFKPNVAATGFVPGKSIVHNARIHEGSYYVYNLDLKDFFHSVDQARIWKCFQLKPFNLIDEEQPVLNLGSATQPGSGIYSNDTQRIHFSIKKGGALTILRKEKGDFSLDDHFIYHHTLEPLSDMERSLIQQQLEDFLKSSRRDLAGILASLCCAEIEVERKNAEGVWVKQLKNVLPQGAPTSPTVTNIVCQRMDFLLSGVAKRFGLRYSRYADDITFSSLHHVYQKDGAFLTELHRIIGEQNFEIKPSKTRLQKTGYRQEVTGLVVNVTPNVPSRYIKQLRMWLYYWETYGYDQANRYFTEQYQSDKSHVKKSEPNMSDVIAGKLNFLKMVKGADHKAYLKLLARYQNLTQSSIDSILDSWETVGIESAMQIYYVNKPAHGKKTGFHQSVNHK